MKMSITAGCLILIVLACSVWADEIECMTTPRGVPQKALIKVTKTKYYSTREMDKEIGELSYYRKFFIFEESPQAYRVGESTRKRSVIGWVPKKACAAWNTNFSLIFTRHSRSKPVFVAMKKEDVGDPNKPGYIEDLGRKESSEPFPVLEKDGSLCKVAFLWETPKGMKTTVIGGTEQARAGHDVERIEQGVNAQNVDQAKVDVIEQLNTVDIMLVFDATGSMKKDIDKVKTQLRSITTDLISAIKTSYSFEPKIRYGVLAFRDYKDKLEGDKWFYFSDLDTSTAKMTMFLRTVEAKGGGGKEEPVYHAVCKAAEMASWNRHSVKIIILMGDAPSHTKNDKDFRRLKDINIPEGDRDWYNLDTEISLNKTNEVLTKHKINFFAVPLRDDYLTKKHFDALKSAHPGNTHTLLPTSEVLDKFKEGVWASLNKARKTYDVAKKIVKEEASKEAVTAGKPGDTAKPDATLSSSEEFLLQAVNLSPEMLSSLGNRKVTTGWISTDTEGLEVLVWIKKREIDQMFPDLAEKLEDAADQQTEILKTITEAYTGNKGKFKGKSLVELMRMLPEFKVANARIVNPLEIPANAKNIARQLYNLTFIMNAESLFNKYEEGWVPIQLLPGGMVAKK